MNLFLIAHIAGRTVAIPADHIDSAVDIGEVVPVPGTTPAIRGLAALRSRVVTVIDTGLALGVEPTAPEHRRPQRVGARGQQRAEGEQQQAADQDRDPTAQVGQPAEQRQGGGVAEQEAPDDRGGPLQLVETDADPGQDVGQRQDDDVGVGRRDEHGQGREDDDGQSGDGGPRPAPLGDSRFSRWAAR